MNLNLVKMARGAGFHVGDQFAAGCSEDDLRKLAAIITAEIEALKPPQRTWVGLTDEDDIDWDGTGNLKQLVEAVEAKLKEKNT
jgi:hypothetical protein